MKRCKYIAVAAIIAVFLMASGCSLSLSTGNERVTYRDVDLALVDINDAQNYSIPQETAGGKSAGAAASKGPVVPGVSVIKLVAEVAPPKSPDGEPLQASHIALTSNGSYAIVTYMLRGEKVYGAVDIFDVSSLLRPKILSTTPFPDFDIAAVVEYNGAIYLAGQRIDESGAGNSALVMRIPYSSKGILLTDQSKQISLAGYFATDIACKGDTVYVTTGTASEAHREVGLFALKSASLEIISKVTSGYPDLRSVAIADEANDVAVFEAKFDTQWMSAANHIAFYAGGDLSKSPRTVDLSKYPASSEAKSKLEYYNNVLLVATNRSGVVIVDPTKQKINANIPAPKLAGIPLENQSSNAISVGTSNSKDIVFIANGEAGLWVGDGGSIEDQNEDGTSSIYGSIRFGYGQSVNYVASKSSLVVAAVGTGGLKVLRLY